MLRLHLIAPRLSRLLSGCDLWNCRTITSTIRNRPDTLAQLHSLRAVELFRFFGQSATTGTAGIVDSRDLRAKPADGKAESRENISIACLTACLPIGLPDCLPACLTASYVRYVLVDSTRLGPSISGLYVLSRALSVRAAGPLTSPYLFIL